MEQKMLKKMRRLVWERIVKNGICWVQVCSAVAGIELLAPITWIQPPLRGVVTRASPSPKNIFMCPAFMRGATTGCVTRHWLSPTIPSISLGHKYFTVRSVGFGVCLFPAMAAMPKLWLRNQACMVFHARECVVQTQLLLLYPIEERKEIAICSKTSQS